MRRLALTVVLSLTYVTSTAWAYSGGTGEPNDPYQIATAQDLIELGNEPGDYNNFFVLTADIDLDPNLPGGQIFQQAVIAPDTDRTGWKFQGIAFSGILDGQGYIIRNLHIQGYNHLGLFGILEKGAVLKNIGMEAVNIKGVGTESEYVGGLAGRNLGYIYSSYSTGIINGESYVGGLVGHNSGIICSSFSTTTVSEGVSIHSHGEYIGGLVGYNSGNIFACYSHGHVMGWNTIGGLAGENAGSVTSCFSTGKVRGDNKQYSGNILGGLVGWNTGSVTASFWDIEISTQSESNGGVGLTTSQMKNASTFLENGWDCVDETANGTGQFWQIEEGNYPSLSIFSGYIPPEPNGFGTCDNPYRIKDANELGSVWYRPWAHYCLGSDIDLNNINWSVATVPYFRGSFDGNDYTIHNLQIEGNGFLGLFGLVDINSIITNVALEAVDVQGIDMYIGGLVGRNFGSISSSHCTGKIICGAGLYVGGLVGVNQIEGVLESSYSAVDISGHGEIVGGLLGLNGGMVTSCYSTGNVTGNNTIGGLVGSGYRSVIEFSYSTGQVDGVDDLGGLAGRYYASTINSSFWDTETSGLTNSATGTGLTTAQMQDINTFQDAGWDFLDETDNGTDDIWWMPDSDYPRLWWESVD